MREQRMKRTVHVGEAMRAFLAQKGAGRRVQAGQVIDMWETIVGSPMAHNATPVRIENGVLTLRARNSVWRSELLMRRTELCAKVNAYFGEDVVKSVEVA
jgi:predicted nucleic acid-binding Zn ribbon protein